MLNDQNEILCYDCNRQTKSKLRDQNKTNTFFMYVQEFYMTKNKQTRKQNIFCYGCII